MPFVLFLEQGYQKDQPGDDAYPRTVTVAQSSATGNGGGETENRPSKKPYHKPSFRFERVFETMALSCGKIDPTQAQCRLVAKNS